MVPLSLHSQILESEISLKSESLVGRKTFKGSSRNQESGNILSQDPPDAQQLPANATVSSLVCQRQDISRWPVVDQSTAEILIFFYPFGIFWVGLSFMRRILIQSLAGNRTPACRESFTGSVQPSPRSSDLQEAVKGTHSIPPDSIVRKNKLLCENKPLPGGNSSRKLPRGN